MRILKWFLIASVLLIALAAIGMVYRGYQLSAALEQSDLSHALSEHTGFEVEVGSVGALSVWPKPHVTLTMY